MRKCILYIVLISYTSLLCKPAMPYLSDLAAHAFFYAQHMSTVHCENGKYHVHIEKLKDLKEEGLPASSKKNTSENETLTAVRFLTGVISFHHNGYTGAGVPSLISGIITSPFLPPRFS